ncbi:GNAT family N-acetyltransferase [Photobacterium japonica]|uniref:GNAT family N-acetyltransferase n=1 Tax=Photobacterium japonica TaxID=2910235 RepID=UPI003D0EC80A
MWLNDTELTSHTVTLTPLRRDHADALIAAATDGQLWDLWFTGVPDAYTIHDYITHALEEQALGRALPFVVRDNVTGDIIGTTRFCNADTKNKRLEIGYTWYAKRAQRSSVNTECKQLLLTHAFEHLDAIAVEFCTHWHNQASRQAIARLGAKQDGVLRNHKIMPDGSYRDTVVFSIINHEWPAVKMHLRHKLAAYQG